MSLTGKTIGQLDHLTSSLTGNEAFPIQYNGSTYHISQSQIIANLATTGSNTFTGVQTISGSNGILKYSGNAASVNPSSPTLADIHAVDSYPWLERFYNDSFSQQDVVMAYFAWDDGRFVFHNESNQSIGLQVNGYNAENGLLVYPDKVAFVNNIEITGSIKAPSITGSLFGTASWAQNASTASSADNFTVRGTLTATTIVAQTITSSTEFITGSTKFGSLITDTHQFTGSVSMTGSLSVIGNPTISVTTPGYNVLKLSSVNSGFGFDGSNNPMIYAAGSTFVVNATINAQSSNAYDIGTSQNRYRTGYFATSLATPSLTTGTTASLFMQTSGGTIFSSLISGSQPSNNPSSSLILISGSITPTGSLTGASAVLLNTVMSASNNNQILTGLDINPTFNNGAFTGVSNIGLRVLTNVAFGAIGTGLFWDNTNTRLGIGTNAPTYLLDINSSLSVARIRSSGQYAEIYIGNVNNYGRITYDNTNSDLYIQNLTTGKIFFKAGSNIGAVLFSTANLLLQNGGTFTDNGYRLQVSGSGAASGSLFIDGLSTFTGNISGSQPSNNPSSSLILISGSIRPTGSLTGASTVLLNTVMSASANSQTLVGLDIAPAFDNGAFTGVTNYSVRHSSDIIPSSQGTINLGSSGLGYNIINTAKVMAMNGYYLELHAGNTNSGILFRNGRNATEIARFAPITSNFILQNGGTFTDNGYRLQVSGSGAASGSLFIDGLTTHTGNISGSQPSTNPSSSLILISGSIRPTGSLSGSSAVLMNTVMSASANNQTLVGLDISPTFNNGAFTGVTNLGSRTKGIHNIYNTAFNESFNIEVRADELNTGTSALYIYPKESANHRMFLGSGSRQMYSLDLTYLTTGISGLASLSLGQGTSGLFFGGANMGYSRPSTNETRLTSNFSNSVLTIYTTASGAENARFTDKGNLLLGTTTDNSYRLQIINSLSGSLYVSGSSLLSGSVNVIGNTNITGSLLLSTGSMFGLPTTSSVTPVTGSMYWSSSLLFIWDGSRYMSASFV